MRVLNQITFEAKDDAEALRLASERLGKDAVILSTRRVRLGGFMGFFQRSVLMVSAGILQDEPKDGKPKEREKDDSAERLVAFQKLLEFKQATEIRGGAELQESPTRQMAPQNEAAKVIYSPAGIGGPGRNVQGFDNVRLSAAGLASTASTVPSAAGDAVAQRKVFTEGIDTMDPAKLKEEVGNLSKRLDTILQRLGTMADEPETKPDRNFEAGLPGVVMGPGRGSEPNELYRKLVEAEVDADYARQLAEEFYGHKRTVSFSKWLESKIRCASDTSSKALGGRRIMLLGPTGVGKTTTIAKLAAIQALWEHKNILLLTSDTYRIAAVDQLRTYAKILGVPIEVIFEIESFAGILEEHSDAELMLLDTAGRGHRDRKNLETLEILHDVFKPDAVHLVLAANMKYRDMVDVVQQMSIIPISHVIFTKLDETMSYGAIFNILRSLDRPISFFTTGQNVPNDIEVASSARLAGFLMNDGTEKLHRE